LIIWINNGLTQSQIPPLAGRRVHPNIVCKTCIFSKGPAPFADAPEKSNCLIYKDEDGVTKPNSVYFDGEECEYHMTEAELMEEEKEEGSR